MNTTKEDIYTRITNRIVEALEQGVRPWHQPWNAAHAAGKITRPLRHNGEPYSGINVIMLWSEAVAAGYTAPIWMTYRQAEQLGGHVRKGEHGATVVYANRIHKTEIDEDTGEERDRDIPFMKGYTVFNAQQIEGLPERYYKTEIEPVLAPAQRDERAEAFFAETGADIRFGGNQAYYALGSDHVQMPPFEFFEDPQSFYSTLGHETVHWTRHPSRLDRDFGRKKWGDEGYAMEELVAELGSAFLCADLDLTPEVREDHVAYIQNWLKVLKSDKRAIFTAAAHAQRACDFLHGLQPKPAPEPDADPSSDPDAQAHIERPAGPSDTAPDSGADPGSGSGGPEEPPGKEPSSSPSPGVPRQLDLF